GAASDTEGSPLAPPRVRAPITGRFELSARRVEPGAPPLSLAWSLPWPRGRAAIEAYDLDGTRLGILMPEHLVAARGELRWSATTLPPGIVLLVLRARPEVGPEALVVKRVLRISGVEPSLRAKRNPFERPSPAHASHFLVRTPEPFESASPHC